MPLSKVQTVLVERGDTDIATDGSDHISTLNTIVSKSLTWGTLAPGEKANPMIVYLRVPAAPAIRNITFGLTNTGSMTFASNVFGVATQPVADFNYVPNTSFLGVNSPKLASNVYNISVPNRGENISDYVYLDVDVPSDYEFKGETLRYQWWFEYSE